MVKRLATDDIETARTAKRSRVVRVHLFDLSNELLLRILSHASVRDLMTCQRASRKLSTLARDSQLWKAAFYNRFVRPRIRRLPISRQHPLNTEQFPFSSKLSQWLDEEKLARSGTTTNWQRQYKIRHNWAVGSCGLQEIPVASRSSTLPVLARLQDGIVYTADVTSGLGAWDYKAHRNVLASQSLGSSCAKGDSISPPVSLALDLTVSGHSQRLAIGHQNGSFSIYSFDKKRQEFSHLYEHPASSNGDVTAIALLSPFLFTASRGGDLSLYKFPSDKSTAGGGERLEHPSLISSLKRNAACAPMCLSLRRQSGETLLASIAYTFYDFTGRGWSVGIQEVHLQADGEVIQSRLAHADQRQPWTWATMPFSRHEGFWRPTCISYSHPYCLVSYTDNTLTSFLVTSTPSSLSIGAGDRLSGHASSVLAAQVGNRGKAISVSSMGDEVRVWQLEGLGQSGRSRHAGSVRVTPEKRQEAHDATSKDDDASLGLEGQASWAVCRLDSSEEQQMSARSCVGFDDESLVILSRRGQDRQSLMIYDFT